MKMQRFNKLEEHLNVVNYGKHEFIKKRNGNLELYWRNGTDVGIEINFTNLNLGCDIIGLMILRTLFSTSYELIYFLPGKINPFVFHQKPSSLILVSSSQ